MNLEMFIIFFSAISFLVYGISSFSSKRMISEYKRWNCQDYRYVIATLQILAGIGLFLGLLYPLLICVVSSLLTIMMFVAIFVRIRIKDTIINTLPAIFYSILNLIIFYNSLKSIDF